MTALLALFLAVGAFAYPLALPIPLLALAVLLWPERRRLRAAVAPRGSWLRRRLVAARSRCAASLEKAVTAVEPVVDPAAIAAAPWGGDLTRFMPEHQFVALPSTGCCSSSSARCSSPRSCGSCAASRATLALGPRRVVLVFGAASPRSWFRPRDFGWYFHFKALAFVGPLAVLLAAVGISRLRRLRVGAAARARRCSRVQGARDEMVVHVRPDAARRSPRCARSTRCCPPGASVRLDMAPNQQLWGAYFLSGQPRVLADAPLTTTSYPHVPGVDQGRLRARRPPRHAAAARGAGRPAVARRVVRALPPATRTCRAPTAARGAMVQTVDTI